MAQVMATMDDVKKLTDNSPAFSQALSLVAMERYIDELEAEKAAAPVCECQNDDAEA
tara:strand:+ start:297 stop:467 length:171 start_codon:yes stop_codon:yes gene_type:complete